MKKTALLITLLGLSLLTQSMWGQVVGYVYQSPRTIFTTVTAAPGIRVIGTTAAFHQLTWNVTGTVATCQIQVDSSADGTSWSAGAVIGSTLCTSNGQALSVSTVVNYVRINVTAISGAGATVTATLSGYANNPSGGGGTTINPTNNVLPKRTSGTTFGDSALTDNGTTVTSTEPITLTQGTITTSNPVISHTVTWNAGGVAFTNWLSNITCTASAANSRGMAVQIGGVDALVLNFTGANCATSTQLLVGKASAGGVIGMVGGTSGTSTITGPAVAGTITNPIALSNALSIPAGTTASSTSGGVNVGSGIPSVQVATGTNAGSWANANSAAIQFNGTGRVDNCSGNNGSLGFGHASGSGTDWCLDTAGNLIVNNGTHYLRPNNSCTVTADITLTVNTDITVCSFSLPAIAYAWSFQCKIPWVISAGTGTNTLAIKVNPSQTPTGTTGAMAEIKTSNANAATEAYANFSTSGATTILTSGTITPAATVFQAEISGTVLASATAGTFAIVMQAAGTTATAAAKAGATCWLY